MIKPYWQFPTGTIEAVESQIPWFQENNKKLDDYLFEDTRIEFEKPVNPNIGEVRNAIHTFITFRELQYDANGNPIKMDLPSNVKEKVISLLKPYEKLIL